MNHIMSKKECQLGKNNNICTNYKELINKVNKSIVYQSQIAVSVD